MILSFFIAIIFPQTSYGFGKWTCIGAFAGEFFLPGLGYGLLGHYDKMLIFGGARWAAANKYWTYSDSSEYLNNPDKIYRYTSLGMGRKKTDIYLSKETFYGNSYNSIYSNLFNVTIFDFYEGKCKKTSNTYNLMLSPYRIMDYGNSPYFWGPIAYVSLVPLEEDLVTYHVDPGMTRNDMLIQSFVENQLIGISEEMLFRGVIQHEIFDLFSRGFDRDFSRWGSIIMASTIFGAAHNGKGFTANPGYAFLVGVYLGWLYHPTDGELNLVTPIAIHSWWDTIGMHRRIQGANFAERANGETAETSSQNKLDTSYPLLNIHLRF